MAPAPTPAAVATEVRHTPDKPSANGPPSPTPPASDGDEALFEKPDPLAGLVPDHHLAAELNHTPKADAPHAARPTPASASASSGGRKFIAIVVDAAMVLLLLGVGVFLGELLAQQSTREVLTDAGSAAKFPPIELLLWMAPPVMLALVYALLASRGKTIGAWLRRRAAD